MCDKVDYPWFREISQNSGVYALYGELPGSIPGITLAIEPLWMYIWRPLSIIGLGTRNTSSSVRPRFLEVIIQASTLLCVSFKKKCITQSKIKKLETMLKEFWRQLTSWLQSDDQISTTHSQCTWTWPFSIYIWGSWQILRALCFHSYNALVSTSVYILSWNTETMVNNGVVWHPCSK